MKLENIDWTLWQSFEAVADCGSLSAGAQKIDISQPTLGRHITRLEQLLSDQLFIRHPKGLHLTEFGEAVLHHVKAMRHALMDLENTLDRSGDTVQGTVRITSSETVCLKILPPLIATLRQTHPELLLDIIPNDSTENLLYGDADIAIRLYQPTQLDVVAKYIGDLELGLFSSPAYLDTLPPLKSVADFALCDLIGFDADKRMINGMRDAGIPVSRDDFAIRTDSSVLQWNLVRAGCGVGIGIVPIGKMDPDVVQIPIPLPDRPNMPVWLASSTRARHTKRVDAVWKGLESGLKDWVVPRLS